MLSRIVAIFTLLLVASTWRLWTSQQVFPQVPVFGWAVHFPLWVDWIAGAILGVSLAVAGIVRPVTRVSSAALLAAATSMSFLLIVDQHRVQPWAYLFVLFGLLLSLCPPPTSMRWSRWLIISVYVYSALSKLDHSFLTSLGAEFVETGFNLIGISTATWPAKMRMLLSAMLPIGELILAGCLVIPRFRRVGVLLGVVSHMTLMAILGPWGMNHKLAVLIWNLKFCVLLVVLFWPRSVRQDESDMEMLPLTRRLPSIFARGTAALALLLPLSEPMGMWDHWPSWGLYSTRDTRLDLFLADEIVSDLPDDLQQFCSEKVYDGYLRKLSVDRWSLEALDVPLYPQDRFQLGVVLLVLRSHSIDREAVAIRRLPPHRLTGERLSQRYTGLKEIEGIARQFWLNTAAR